MKTLIVYATKHGATRKIAEQIADQLGGATLHDIEKGKPPALADYECVVLGSPLMAGAVRKEIKAFAAANAAELGCRRLGLFVSGLQAEGEAEYLSKNFPPELLAAARAKAFLGGIFDPAACGFVARKMMKAIAKLESYTSTIDPARVERFARELAE